MKNPATPTRYSAMAVLRIFLLCCLLLSQGYAQERLLKKRVNLEVQQAPIEEALLQLSEAGDFTYSYASAIFPEDRQVSLNVHNKTVRQTLDLMLPEHIDYRVNNNHLILISKAREPATYQITGKISSAKQPLAQVLIYEVNGLESTLSDADGNFALELPVKYEQIVLSVNKHNYQDTVLLLAPKDQQLKVELRLAYTIPLREDLTSISPQDSVEGLSFVQKVIPDASLARIEAASPYTNRWAQISLLPGIGTNRKMDAFVTNNASLNILIGYSNGLRGAELGGLLNITRTNVQGAQAAGIGNIIGGTAQGVQVAGILNHATLSVEGVQLAGVSNYAQDSLVGVQISGVANTLIGKADGVQLAGVVNLATGNVKGGQVSGVINAAPVVESIQAAGVLNLSRRVKGAQIAGVLNLASDSVAGLQIAGVINMTRYLRQGTQIAGVMNLGWEVQGAQIASVLNFARKVDGYQLGLVNIADTASGTPVGLISIVRKGYHSISLGGDELGLARVSIRTGVRRFYNIFSGSYNNWSKNKLWAFGYGLGTEKLLGRWYLNFEGTAHWMNQGEELTKNLSLLTRLDLNLGYKFSPHWSISLAPALNMLLYEPIETEQLESEIGWAPKPFAKEKFGSVYARFWLGASLAIRFE